MHQPVLLEETISYLITDLSGIYVDCTLGGGGHLKRLFASLQQDARVIAIDKDRDILEKTRKTIQVANVTFCHSDFSRLTQVLAEQNINKVDGIMLDLGVSSFQLDIADRGFSFHEDARLDMRMNRDQDLTAWDIVNDYSEAEISAILFEYGEERYARRIARRIVTKREENSINTTLQLVDIIKSCVPAGYKRGKHPARKTFQALRIAVNGELDALQSVLPQAVDLLKTGGRLCVITFHSLEDRIVKHFMQEKARDCICPPGLPICICGHQAELKINTRKSVEPDAQECEQNSRARSARLRVATKL